MKTVQQLSSGGVIFRHGRKGIEVALIAVKRGEVWELPKGLVEEGENIARTAHREVREETGLDGRIIRKIGSIHYFFCQKEEGESTRVLKVVYFFLMEYRDGDVANHDDEVDDCRWFPMGEAVERVEYENERDILLKAQEMVEEL
ncbi:MAG: NUDIX hydrolase [Deltaproteobacteria bacterium]|nr:NUDIX hydrolase [Deltaproteobacteria bacterium]